MWFIVLWKWSKVNVWTPGRKIYGLTPDANIAKACFLSQASCINKMFARDESEFIIDAALCPWIATSKHFMHKRFRKQQMSKSTLHLFVDDGGFRSWDRSCEAATSSGVICRRCLAGVSRSWQRLYAARHSRRPSTVVRHHVSVEVCTRCCCSSAADLNTAFRTCMQRQVHKDNIYLEYMQTSFSLKTHICGYQDMKAGDSSSNN